LEAGLGWFRLVALNEQHLLNHWRYWAGVLLSSLGYFQDFQKGTFEPLNRHHFPAILLCNGFQKIMTVLYYVHDPMCSWCWAFRPVWDEVQRRLPESVSVTYLLGGLAPDSDSPIPDGVRQEIQEHWRTIQQRVPGIRFNFDFWRACTPRRSTYPACRAVIAAKGQNSSLEDAMIRAIQEAYYLQARNPSDDDVLVDLATHLGLNVERFHKDLNAPETQRQLMDEILQGQRLGARGFPGLILKNEENLRAIRIDYNDAEMILQQMRD